MPLTYSHPLLSPSPQHIPLLGFTRVLPARGTETLTVLPSIVCFSFTTRSATAGSANTTKPKPRARPVARSFMMTTSTTSPYAWKWSRSFSSVVSHEIPPMNSFPWSESITSLALLVPFFPAFPFLSVPLFLYPDHSLPFPFEISRLTQRQQGTSETGATRSSVSRHRRDPYTKRVLQDNKRERRDRERVSATRSNCAKKLQKTWACSGSKERETERALRDRRRKKDSRTGGRRLRRLWLSFFSSWRVLDGCDKLYGAPQCFVFQEILPFFRQKSWDYIYYLFFCCKIRLVLLIFGEIRQTFDQKQLKKNPDERGESKRFSKWNYYYFAKFSKSKISICHLLNTYYAEISSNLRI